MIYGGDRVAELPFIDINNTQLMAMQLNAAKDMYEKGLKLIEDFNKIYGDFYSPFANDQKWYAENVTGAVRNALDLLYAAGIDPLRSAEGRSAIQRIISRMPVDTINAMKANAKRGEAFIENVAKMRAQNLYNEKMDQFLHGNYKDFSTVGDGGAINTFDRLSPDPYLTVDQLLNPIFSNVKPIYDEATTKAKKDGLLHNTVTEERLMQALNDSKADILATPSGKYLMHLAEQEAARIGNGTTADQVFNLWAKNRMSDYLRDDVQSDPVYMANLNARNSLSNQIAAMREQDRLTRAQWADPNNPAVIRANNTGNGRGSDPNKTGFNYPMSVKNAALRKLAGITDGDDSKIPANLVRGQYYALKTFGLKHGMMDPRGDNFTRSFTDKEALEFLGEFAHNENPNMFKYYIGSDRKAVDSNEIGPLYNVTEVDRSKLQSTGQYVSGFYGNKYKSKSTSLDNNTKYVMLYTGNHNARFTDNRTTDEGLLVILYPEVENNGKKTIDFSKPIYRIYRPPVESRPGSRNALTYNDSSQGYISSVSTEIGTKEFKESSTLNDLDNILFEGNPYQN